MPDLRFRVEGVEVVPFAASPQIAFKLRIDNAIAGETIGSITLKSQVQIEATRRRYDAAEQAHLVELFGEPDRWSQTLRSLLWAHVVTVVPRFVDTTLVDVVVPCTFDFNVATTKYAAGLDAGNIPVILLFSGTIFYEASGGALQISQVPWENEARYQLPVSTWSDMMDLYYPNGAWLRLRRDVFDRLRDFKARHGFTTWEEALDRLVPIGTEGSATWQ
jgi:hypothetical protein